MFSKKLIQATAVAITAGAFALTSSVAVAYDSNKKDKKASYSSYDKKNEKQTIVSTAKGAGEFNTLVSLVKAAGLKDTLKSEGPFTVFAPTDAAFEKVPLPVLEALGKDKALLTRVLTYHVVAGDVKAASVVGMDSVKTVEGNTAAISTKDGAKIAGANIVKTDIDAGNGTIHVIDSVILPEDIAAVASKIVEDTPDIVTTAVNAGSFNTLASLVEKAGLVETLQSGNFTVFAPTDDAFAKVPAETLAALGENPEQLKEVLLYHVVPGSVKAEKVVTKTEIKTALGKKATIVASDTGVTIDNANIVKTDIITRNGVIHVIDSIILPKDDRISANY